LDEDAASYALVVKVHRAATAAPRRLTLEDAKIFLPAENLYGAVAELRCYDTFDEQTRHRVSRRVLDGNGEGDHRAECRHRITRKRLAIRLERVRADRKPARRGVFDDRARDRARVGIDGQQRALEVEQIVERELFAAALLQGGESDTRAFG